MLNLKNHFSKRNWLIFILVGMLASSACALASPFDRLVGGGDEPVEAVLVSRTPRPTFTYTPAVTDTPTKTPTATLTPLPTETPTPAIPTETPTLTPEPATETPTPAPTNTPAPAPPPTEPPPPEEPPPPTEPPAPSWEYQMAELYSQPTEANILSIMVAVQDHSGGWIPGYRLVGVDPNGTVTKSEVSAAEPTGYTPPGDVIKTGNTKFEPTGGYVTGTWMFHLESAGGQQVSDSYPVPMDAENRVWFFIRFQPG